MIKTPHGKHSVDCVDSFLFFKPWPKEFLEKKGVDLSKILSQIGPEDFAAAFFKINRKDCTAVLLDRIVDSTSVLELLDIFSEEKMWNYLSQVFTGVRFDEVCIYVDPVRKLLQDIQRSIEAMYAGYNSRAEFEANRKRVGNIHNHLAIMLEINTAYKKSQLPNYLAEENRRRKRSNASKTDSPEASHELVLCKKYLPPFENFFWDRVFKDRFISCLKDVVLKKRQLYRLQGFELKINPHLGRNSNLDFKGIKVVELPVDPEGTLYRFPAIHNGFKITNPNLECLTGMELHYLAQLLYYFSFEASTPILVILKTEGIDRIICQFADEGAVDVYIRNKKMKAIRRVAIELNIGSLRQIIDRVEHLDESRLNLEGRAVKNRMLEIFYLEVRRLNHPCEEHIGVLKLIEPHRTKRSISGLTINLANPYFSFGMLCPSDEESLRFDLRNTLLP
jgi:hypothetical protein